MRILRILAVLLVITTAAKRAMADDTPSPEALQAATQLMSIMSPDMMNQVHSQMFGAMWPAIEQQMRAANVDAATLADLRQALESITRAHITDAMKDAPTIYARHFTVAELHDMISFYQTPTGAKTLRELPKVMGDLMTQMAPHFQDLRVQTTNTVSEILRKHGYAK